MSDQQLETMQSNLNLPFFALDLGLHIINGVTGRRVVLLVAGERQQERDH
jgi:hypothetical protein